MHSSSSRSTFALLCSRPHRLSPERVNLNLCPHETLTPLRSPSPGAHICLLSRWVRLVDGPPTSAAPQPLPAGGGLPSLSSASSRPVHVPAVPGYSPLFRAEYCSTACMPHSYLSVCQWTLGCSCGLAGMNSRAVNMGVQVCVQEWTLLRVLHLHLSPRYGC